MSRVEGGVSRDERLEARGLWLEARGIEGLTNRAWVHILISENPIMHACPTI